MTTKPSTVDSATVHTATSSSSAFVVANDLQQKCQTIESGLNDLRNVLKTLATTCAILEKSAEKLGSGMMEIRGIIARKESPKAGKKLSMTHGIGSISAAERVPDASSSSKLVTPFPEISNASNNPNNVNLVVSGARNTIQSPPGAVQPGAFSTPAVRMSGSSVAPSTEPTWPTASISSRLDTPARRVASAASGTTNASRGATGSISLNDEKHNLTHGTSTRTSSQTLPPRRARKQGLRLPRPAPSSEHLDNIGAPSSGKQTPHTNGDLGGSNAPDEAPPSTIVAQHNPLKQVHFDVGTDSVSAPVGVQLPVEQEETTNAGSLLMPTPRMELRIRIRNPTKNAPGRIENISGLRVRIPRAALDKVPSALLSTSVATPSSPPPGSQVIPTHSAPALSSKTDPSTTMLKPKRAVGRPRKRRKTTSTSKKIKTEDIEASLTANEPLLQVVPDLQADVGEPPTVPVSAVPIPREDRSTNKVASLSKAMEQCKDAFSNYLVAASRESTTPASSTRAPPSKKRAPTQKRLASSSVPSTATFSPKIESQDFPLYPSTLSVSSPPAASLNGATPIPTSTLSVAPLPTACISPPFLVPSNAPSTNPEPLSESTAKPASRPRRQRGARLAELDREAEQRMRVSREKRDKTRWDPRSGRRVIVPTGTVGHDSDSEMVPGEFKANVSHVVTPISKGMAPRPLADSQKEMAMVVVKEEEEEEEGIEW